MKKTFDAIFDAALLTAGLSLSACGSNAVTATRDGGSDADPGCPGCPAVDGGTAVLPSDPAAHPAWLATNAYRSWVCDPSPQAALPDSPHGRNVICINPTLAAARSGSGAWPAGSAAVKVTYNANGGEIGRYLDLRRSTATGVAGWSFLATSPSGNVLYSGAGADANATCGNCHSNGGRDFVRRWPI